MLVTKPSIYLAHSFHSCMFCVIALIEHNALRIMGWFPAFHEYMWACNHVRHNVEGLQCQILHLNQTILYKVLYLQKTQGCDSMSSKNHANNFAWHIKWWKVVGVPVTILFQEAIASFHTISVYLFKICGTFPHSQKRIMKPFAFTKPNDLCVFTKEYSW